VIPFVGLTGGIGSGKSTALAALERLGAAVLSTDTVVHELYADGEVRDAVVERFGSLVAPNGTIDRAALARAAFATDESRRWLEGLLWPRVGKRMAAWRERLEHCSPHPRAAVVEVPLLFESGMEAAFDATIAVIAEEELRTRRASGRGHQALDGRLARQLPQQEKAQRATYVVPNDGEIEQLERKLSSVLEMLSA
jgi:dephospho-CoA kinase